MFAALHLPDLPVVAALRAFPSERGRPCRVVASLGQLDEGPIAAPIFQEILKQ